MSGGENNEDQFFKKIVKNSGICDRKVASEAKVNVIVIGRNVR